MARCSAAVYQYHSRNDSQKAGINCTDAFSRACPVLLHVINTVTSLTLPNLGPVCLQHLHIYTCFTLEHGYYAGSAQPEGVHSLVPVVDVQLVLQHLFPLKSEADVSAAIEAVSSDRQITISALMPVYRSACLLACRLACGLACSLALLLACCLLACLLAC